jgi:hypothetical protein
MRCRRVRSCATGDDRARRLRAGCAASKRQQRNIPCALDGFTEPALVTGTNAGHAARKNLAAFLYELRQNVGAFVVDEVHLLDAELADLFLAEVLALAAARSSAGTSRSSAGWACVTARAAMSATWTAVTGTAFAARTDGALCLLLFLCHTCHLSDSYRSKFVRAKPLIRLLPSA